MSRKKVKLAFISNNSSRKTTFKKRKKGLIKKVKEISTLCGISACAIIYSSYDAYPEVWPSNSDVERVISEFKALPPIDQNKKMVDQETFLRQRITKVTKQWTRQSKDNREMEMTEVMFRYLVGNIELSGLNILDLNDLGFMTEQYLKDLNHRGEILQRSNMEIGESSNVVVDGTFEEIQPLAVVAATTSPATAMIHEVGSSSSYLAPTPFFNSIHQQQLHHLTAPHFRHSEQPLDENHDQNQIQQQCFVQMMNDPEKISYTADQISFPFMDDNHNNRNHHHQPPHQQQQVPDGCYNASTSASSSSTVPVTSPNFTNNIWFR